MEELHQLIPLKPQSHLLGQECLMELGDSQWGVVGLPFPIKVSKCFESLITRWESNSCTWCSFQISFGDLGVRSGYIHDGLYLNHLDLQIVIIITSDSIVTLMLVRFACNIVIKKKKNTTTVSIQPWSLLGDGVDVLSFIFAKNVYKFFSQSQQRTVSWKWWHTSGQVCTTSELKPVGADCDSPNLL